jgi:hypothetical protein
MISPLTFLDKILGILSPLHLLRQCTLNFGIGDIFSSKSTTNVTPTTDDHSTNLNAEGGSTVAGGDLITTITTTNTLDGGAITGALGVAGAANELMAALGMNAANTSAALAASGMDSAFSTAGLFADSNAKLAGQSMDTALEFAKNAKPAATAFMDTVPILALAAAAAAAFYFIFKK